MSHAYVGGRKVRVAGGEAPRQANLLGAISLAVAERGDDAARVAAAHRGAAPAAS